ncbi:MAG: Tol-Pal system subunit TolQ [Oceanicaulis sp.]|jgi:biopolymer transport protein TolQ|uniref:MotA/TolQ/ExbB proton channel family protein n=1 Tax=unclassified Oceanicaulis TaxID=2632123 RepID=UPI000066A28D|nr:MULTISPECIES: MotA/TolQ/ExbB proton channel family protein [unclassified Oceanicaulis]EAP90016.1 TolQ, tolQ protein [Oceanicaulis sp. HTCC2633]MAB69229.1 Tol-Pal system subunit TolQ [Oceanicaulis sp.]MBC37496.1 Tol-Pal system subunit TolQ [Oceanicaulis sp.]MBG34211.1 Tol-Pal system subunit TolQ [Oceanicaulis sp.]HBU63380.1 Tol-Pal system subunit TolQ [Oceanicaulis sp.]
MESVAVELTGPATELTIMHLFMRADIVVKAVMAILALMSIWSWAIAIEKWMQLNKAHAGASRFENDFWSGGSLDQLVTKYAKPAKEPFGRVLAAAMRDWDGYAVAKSGGAEANRELNKMEAGLGVLSIIGSSAPFIGLFGTVWGIMNAFRSIAASENTSLAVVAPGISEALFATALGLLAAIPAVIFFNALSSNLAKYAARLEGLVDDLAALASRGN